MYTSFQKKKKSKVQNFSFFKKKHRKHQHDLLRLQRAYDYLSNINPSGDRDRKQLRGIQLAQQLVDPHIQSVQSILSALASKIAFLQAGGQETGMEANESKDNCHQYPTGFHAADYDAAWIHYVNCLLGIPKEDSVIETDVYNYIDPDIVIEEENGEEDDEDEEETDDGGATEPEGPVPNDDEDNPNLGFLSRLFNRFIHNNP